MNNVKSIILNDNQKKEIAGYWKSNNVLQDTHENIYTIPNTIMLKDNIVVMQVFADTVKDRKKPTKTEKLHIIYILLDKHC